MESQDNWRPAGHFHRGFVLAVQLDIDKLSLLPPNWDGYGAPAIDLGVIASAKIFIASLAENLASRPLVVPTPNGTLQLEWHHGERSEEIEFESARCIRFLQWDPSKGVEEEDTISVGEIERAEDLIHWFMSGAGQ